MFQPPLFSHHSLGINQGFVYKFEIQKKGLPHTLDKHTIWNAMALRSSSISDFMFTRSEFVKQLSKLRS